MKDYKFIYKEEDGIILGQIKNDLLINYQLYENTIDNNIYRARVKSFFKSMDAYIVDIGEEKDALLKSSQVKGSISLGQDRIVQIKKIMPGNKMHIVSEKIDFIGKYIILNESYNKNFYSKKLSRMEKEKLSEINWNFKYKVKFRSGAKSRDKVEIEGEYRYLSDLKESIDRERHLLPTPKLLYEYSDLNKFLSSKEKVITNIEDIKEDKCIFNSKFNPHYDKLINLQVKYIDDKIIKFNESSSIVVEKTEALTVIDINQGSAYHELNKYDMSFKINADSLDYICQAIKLKKIKKMLVIDFLRMRDKDRENLQLLFKKKLKEYNIKSSIFGFTEMGLFELIVY